MLLIKLFLFTGKIIASLLVILADSSAAAAAVDVAGVARRGAAAAASPALEYRARKPRQKAPAGARPRGRPTPARVEAGASGPCQGSSSP